MRRIVSALILSFGSCISLHAQTKAPVQPADYGQWEALAVPREFGGLSPDGKWIAYGINRSNRENELRITNIADGTARPPRSARKRFFLRTRAGSPTRSVTPRRRKRK